MVGLTAEQGELSQTAARVLADAARKDPLPPEFAALPLELNRPLWDTLAELGLLGLAVPESVGGGGAGLLEQCLLAERVGAAVPAVPFAPTAAVTAVLARCAGSQAAEVLGEVVSGGAVVVPAWETFPAAVVPGRRSSALAVSGSTVTGTLRAVPFGMDADRLLAIEPGGAVVLVQLTGPGVRRARVPSLDIMEPLASVVLTAAPCALVPWSQAGGFPVAEILTVLAAELVGTGQRALDGAVSYAMQRRQFGRPIGSFQAIKHMLADRYVQLDAARLLVHTAASDPGSGPGAELAARTALVAASDAADAATADALQAHGGIGFTWEHPSHVLLKRARARRALLGSAARQLDALATHLLAR
ncbi:MAG TPA: acyl-CoA dehydrogenase family protein [Pseudonocardia sp.]|uniref:acyl-CoA dehydrogenase family protein n=1 Tax=Pseudonocardia sp. TaxID=60912 RepID=UPI002ED92AC8